MTLSLWGCGGSAPATIPPEAVATKPAPTKMSGKISEVSPPEVIQQLQQLLDDYQPQVAIVGPKPNEVLQDNTVSVRFEVKDLPLFKDEKLGLGPHLHVFLDDQPYQAVYDVSQPVVFKDLAAGTHTIRAFAGRPWHESFKNEGAYAQTTFHVFTKTSNNNPNPDLPLLTYSRPQGSYGAEPILLDFYLTNAPLHFVAQEDSKDEVADWRIRVTVNGDSFVLDRWQPIYLKGFKPGKNWVQLEYINEKGNPVQNVYNNTVRLFSYEPNGKDALSKLVRGEISFADARGIVDPKYKPAPQPTPELVKTPKPEASPKPSPIQSPTVSPAPEEVPVPQAKPPLIPVIPIQPSPSPEVKRPEVKSKPTEEEIRRLERKLEPTKEEKEKPESKTEEQLKTPEVAPVPIPMKEPETIAKPKGGFFDSLREASKSRFKRSTPKPEPSPSVAPVPPSTASPTPSASPTPKASPTPEIKKVEPPKAETKKKVEPSKAVKTKIPEVVAPAPKAEETPSSFFDRFKRSAPKPKSSPSVAPVPTPSASPTPTASPIPKPLPVPAAKEKVEQPEKVKTKIPEGVAPKIKETPSSPLPERFRRSTETVKPAPNVPLIPKPTEKVEQPKPVETKAPEIVTPKAKETPSGSFFDSIRNAAKNRFKPSTEMAKPKPSISPTPKPSPVPEIKEKVEPPEAVKPKIPEVAVPKVQETPRSNFFDSIRDAAKNRFQQPMASPKPSPSVVPSVVPAPSLGEKLSPTEIIKKPQPEPLKAKQPELAVPQGRSKQGFPDSVREVPKELVTPSPKGLASPSTKDQFRRPIVSPAPTPSTAPSVAPAPAKKLTPSEKTEQNLPKLDSPKLPVTKQPEKTAPEGEAKGKFFNLPREVKDRFRPAIPSPKPSASPVVIPPSKGEKESAQPKATETLRDPNFQPKSELERRLGIPLNSPVTSPSVSKTVPEKTMSAPRNSEGTAPTSPSTGTKPER